MSHFILTLLLAVTATVVYAEFMAKVILAMLEGRPT